MDKAYICLPSHGASPGWVWLWLGKAIGKFNALPHVIEDYSLMNLGAKCMGVAWVRVPHPGGYDYGWMKLLVKSLYHPVWLMAIVGLSYRKSV